MQSLLVSAKTINDNLSLFQPADFESPLKKNLQLINSMIELNYLESINNEIRFTSPGINYMFRKHKEFLQNIQEQNIDFGIFSGAIAQLRENMTKYGLSTIENSEKFCRNNMLYKISLDD